MQFLRGKDDVTADMEEMETEACEQEAKASSDDDKFTMMRLLKAPELRVPVIITVVLQVAQQFSGINCVSAPGWAGGGWLGWGVRPLRGIASVSSHSGSLWTQLSVLSTLVGLQ